jgi:hypothetical protein
MTSGEIWAVWIEIPRVTAETEFPLVYSCVNRAICRASLPNLCDIENCSMILTGLIPHRDVPPGTIMMYEFSTMWEARQSFGPEAHVMGNSASKLFLVYRKVDRYRMRLWSGIDISHVPASLTSFAPNRHVLEVVGHISFNISKTLIEASSNPQKRCSRPSLTLLHNIYVSPLSLVL